MRKSRLYRRICMMMFAAATGGAMSGCGWAYDPVYYKISSGISENVLDYITDPVFKAYATFCMTNENEGLIEEAETDTMNYPAWDSDGDGKLSFSEAANVKCIDLYVWYSNHGEQVKSLEGLEYFTGLKVLDCSKNDLHNLDVTKNTALTTLYCHNNQLTKLDVTKNSALRTLFCLDNQLPELNVAENTALYALACSTNQLTKLDVTKNSALIYLRCSSNQLTELNVTQNTALITLNCYNNQLTELDVTKNTALTDLSCNSNQLTKLDVKGCTALTRLECFDNRLTELDASNMANPTHYTLGCGRQKNSEGGDQQLTLTLREEQKERWNKGLGPNSSGGSNNKGVVLAD